MMTFYELIPWIISGTSLLFVILTFARNGRKDSRKAEAEAHDKLEVINSSLLKANMKLDQVCATTNETRSDIKSMDQRVAALDKEMEVVKRDLSTCFDRIDQLKEDIKK